MFCLRGLTILCLLVLVGCTFSGTATMEDGSVQIAAVVATFTPTSTVTPLPTDTPTPVPPTATHTPSPIPPTDTNTPLPPPTATNTPVPTVVLPTVTPSPTAPPVAVCDHTITAGVSTFSGSNVSPGAVVCIAAGNRGPLTLSSLTGTAALPIIVRNSGGVVTITATTGRPFVIENSRHVRILGDGVSTQCGAEFSEANQQCGIRTFDGTNGVSAFVGVSDLEIGYLETGGSDDTPGITFAAGIKLHSTTGQTFNNAYFHHLYVHDVRNECVYIGLAVSDGASPFAGARLMHSLLTRCGWDAIDWKQVQSGGEIGYNVIGTAGNPTDTTQDKGISFVSSGFTRVHHNVIGGKKGGTPPIPGECIKTLNPLNGIVIEDNTIGGCGREHVLDRFTNVNTTVRNNTLWLPGDGIDVRGTGIVEGNVVQ